MTRIAPIDWRTLARVFEADGWKERRTKGDHVVFVKEGVARPIVIPKYDEIGLDIITGNLRTAGMSRERYLEILAQV